MYLYHVLVFKVTTMIWFMPQYWLIDSHVTVESGWFSRVEIDLDIESGVVRARPGCGTVENDLTNVYPN
jgi:hypothetical protein